MKYGTSLGESAIELAPRIVRCWCEGDEDERTNPLQEEVKARMARAVAVVRDMALFRCLKNELQMVTVLRL